MYYQNYEDYMRQVLGYPISDPNIYETYDYRNAQIYEDTYSLRNQDIICNLSDDEIHSCYPEIYHSVYPMVCKVCEANTEPITKELIEKMTDEVYLAFEGTNTIVNVKVESPRPENNRSLSNSTINHFSGSSVRTPRPDIRSQRTPIKEESRSSRTDAIKASSIANREVVPLRENRQQNSTLRDLIKILILLRLFGNRPNRPRPPRTPFPGGPGRPPFPGGRPPMGPGGPNRPPIQPRDYSEYLNF